MSTHRSYFLQETILGGLAPAVDETAPFERVPLDATSWIDVARGWVHGADHVLDALVQTVAWQQGRRWMYDRYLDDPRLSCWYKAGDPAPHPVLAEARGALEQRYGARFGGIGLNYYRDGRDSVAPHRDRELRYLDDTLVAIITFGATRPFLVRPRRGGASRDLAPASGDLVVMGGRCQADWEHGVPKTARAGARVSAMFRWSSRAGRLDRGPSWRSPRRFDSSP